MVAMCAWVANFYCQSVWAALCRFGLKSDYILVYIRSPICKGPGKTLPEGSDTGMRSE